MATEQDAGSVVVGVVGIGLKKVYSECVLHVMTMHWRTEMDNGIIRRHKVWNNVQKYRYDIIIRDVIDVWRYIIFIYQYIFVTNMILILIVDIELIVQFTFINFL